MKSPLRKEKEIKKILHFNDIQPRNLEKKSLVCYSRVKLHMKKEKDKVYKIDDFYQSKKRMRSIGKILAMIISILILLILFFNGTLMIKSLVSPEEIPDFFGLKSFVIVSESMEPTIMTGDAIFVKEVKEEELKVGDIISFHTGNIINSHRIIEIVKDGENTKYRTKGDHNQLEDKELVSYEQIEGKYQFRIAGFGKFMEILKSKVTLVILLIILVVLSAYQVKIAKRKLKRKEKRYEFNHKTS